MVQRFVLRGNVVTQQDAQLAEGTMVPLEDHCDAGAGHGGSGFQHAPLRSAGHIYYLVQLRQEGPSLIQ